MRTILRVGPYGLYFYAGDRDEPPHVHVEREDKIAKFWLDPVRPQGSGRFERADIDLIRRIIGKHQAMGGVE